MRTSRRPFRTVDDLELATLVPVHWLNQQRVQSSLHRENSAKATVDEHAGAHNVRSLAGV